MAVTSRFKISEEDNTNEIIKMKIKTRTRPQKQNQTRPCSRPGSLLKLNIARVCSKYGITRHLNVIPMYEIPDGIAFSIMLMYTFFTKLCFVFISTRDYEQLLVNKML